MELSTRAEAKREEDSHLQPAAHEEQESNAHERQKHRDEQHPGDWKVESAERERRRASRLLGR